MRNLFLAAMLLVLALPVNAIEPLSLYGQEAVYTVERKGKPIGTYQIRFAPWQQEGLQVDVEMQLGFRYLALFDYEFNYRAREYWQGNKRLERMQVQINDDGKQTEYRFSRKEGGLYRDNAEQGDEYLGDQLMTSNHWHPGVVQQDALINTLTGSVSKLDVTLEAAEAVTIGSHRVEASRYRLGGELGDTLSWYDQRGRWLGMEFSARDGSRVRIWMEPELYAHAGDSL